MKTIYHYIDAHHEDFGVALFVLPAVVLPYLLIGIVYALVSVIQ